MRWLLAAGVAAGASAAILLYRRERRAGAVTRMNDRHTAFAFLAVLPWIWALGLFQLVFLFAPALIFVPAALLSIAILVWPAERNAGRAAQGCAAAAWAAYGGYEWLMQIWSRAVIAPIRLDLFPIGLLLYVATIAAVRLGTARRRP